MLSIISLVSSCRQSAQTARFDIDEDMEAVFGF